MSNPKMSSTQLAPRDQVSTIELVKEDPVAMVDAKLQQKVHHVFFSREAQNCNAIIVLTPLVPWPKIWVVHPFWKKPNASRENHKVYLLIVVNQQIAFQDPMTWELRSQWQKVKLPKVPDSMNGTIGLEHVGAGEVATPCGAIHFLGTLAALALRD